MRMIGALTGLVVGLALSANAADYRTVVVNDAPFSMPPIREWVCPERSFPITDYGAETNGRPCTAAFAAAIAACHAAGGGHVIVPSGTWTTGAIHLRSNVDLHLEKGATIDFTDNPSDYLPAVPTSWEGVECLGYSPLVYAYGCENVSITGEGTLAPRMDFWRTWFDRSGEGCQAATETLYYWCSTNAPLAARNVPALMDSRMRPQLIQVNRCRNVRLDGFRIRESPFWTIHLYLSTDVVVRNLDVYARGHNNDGVDVEMSSNVLVENCRFDQGDDGFVFKSGRNQDGWRLNTPTENVVCRDCTFVRANALACFGSELSGCIRNMWVTNCTVESTLDAVYLKTNERRGGFVENVWVSGIRVGDVKSAVVGLETDVFYQWARFPTFERRYTRFRNINVSDVAAASAGWGFRLLGDAHEPPQGLHFSRVRVGDVRRRFKDVRNCFDVTFTDVVDGVNVATNGGWSGLLAEIIRADRKADEAVAALSSPKDLADWQWEKRKAWLDGIGGLPECTPLRAKEGPVRVYDGFTLQNVLFESMPGVYAVGHLALPRSPAFKPPYPVVLMSLGHTEAGIRGSRYGWHLVEMARAGFAVFAWDPISQGERRQCAARFDSSFGESVTEHSRLGARGWLVGWNFMRFRIWDAMRAADYVQTRRDLDCSRLGICGTSGGGTVSTYLQALDPRIKVAFPNCYVSTIRDVFAERGCQDPEQFFWNQLPLGLNHAALLALGQPRVALAIGSRWDDFFPHAGASDTFSVLTNVAGRVGLKGPFWHFHCAGPHGLPAPTRAAQVDWMRSCIQGKESPKALAAYARLSSGDHEASDPVVRKPLPFPADAAIFTKTGFVRDIPGFRSLYEVLAERAATLRVGRGVKSREDLREVVRRRAAIRPLDELGEEMEQPFAHPTFNWWYLKGAFGVYRENEAAMLAVLGRSAVGRDAENILRQARRNVRENGEKPIVLRAKRWECIAAAHAYAAEPQLFSAIELVDPPPSWTDQVLDLTPGNESFATSIWGALEEYDWTDLLPVANSTSYRCRSSAVGSKVSDFRSISL